MKIVEIRQDAFGQCDHKIAYVKAPRGLPGVKAGAKLAVIQEFISDARCPWGPGLKCLEVEGGYRVVYTKSEAGIAWLKIVP